jgi:hypothetical protein
MRALEVPQDAAEGAQRRAATVALYSSGAVQGRERAQHEQLQLECHKARACHGRCAVGCSRTWCAG